MQKSIQKVISLLLTAVLLISYVPAYGFADVVSEDSYAASDGETGETIAPEDAAVLSDNVEEVEDISTWNAFARICIPVGMGLGSIWRIWSVNFQRVKKRFLTGRRTTENCESCEEPEIP